MRRTTILKLFIITALTASSQPNSSSPGMGREWASAAEPFLVSNMWKAVPARDVKPEYIAGTDLFWFVFKTTKATDYYLVTPSKKSVQPLFDKHEFVASLSKITGKTYDESHLSVFPRFANDGKSFLLDIDGKRIRYDMATKMCQEEQLPKREPYKAPNRRQQMMKYSKDSTVAAYCKGHDLYVEREGKATRLTTDGCDLFSYSDDARNREDNIFTTKGTWIGDSHTMYVLREDHRGIGTLPTVSSVLGGHPRLVSSITGSDDFAMPGDKHVVQYELTILDADNATARKMKIEKWKDQKVKVLYTTKDNRYLYLQRTRRTCDELDICRIDLRTGNVEVVLHEECKPYFSDRMQSITFINGDRQFIWWSERTGYGHFYLYNADGTLVRQLTEGEWMAERIVRFDEKRQTLFFIGHGKEQGANPYFSYLYSTRLANGSKVRLLTPENADHSITLSPSGRYFVDNYSRVDLAPASVLRDSEGRLVGKLAEADLTDLYAMGWKMPEPFTVKAADGETDLYGVMWKPHDFDPNRRYPIISYVYPGPQQEALPTTFTTTGDHNCALAQLGFIVINIGHRGGSPLRGLKYRTYGYGNLRDYPLADDKHAIEQLAQRHKFIDLSRVGIFGHSGGGFMSATALMTYPDFYKVAVASSGNHDNNMFHLEWGETFHGVRQEVVRGDTVFKCKIPTNLELAKNLKGHLLLVTGDEDNNVHPGHTFRLADALIKAGKQFDMLVLPGQGHLYKGAAADYWRRRIWLYFVRHLQGNAEVDDCIDM
ncbi:MAG: DPP IV N-terminal domain-containing protein [Prevotella sp.]